MSVLFKLRGESEVALGDCRIPLSADMGCVLGGGTPFNFNFPARHHGGTLGYLIGPEMRQRVFEGKSLHGDHGLLMAETFAEPLLLPLPVNARLRRIIHDIEGCVFTGGPRKSYLEAKGLELLAEVAETICDPAPAADRTAEQTEWIGQLVSRARDELLGAILDPPSILDLADELGLDYKVLTYHFRKRYSETPSAFIRNQRLDLARRELTSQGVTVSAVARTLGYSHPSHFIRAYRLRFGVTPGQRD